MSGERYRNTNYENTEADAHDLRDSNRRRLIENHRVEYDTLDRTRAIRLVIYIQSCPMELYPTTTACSPNDRIRRTAIFWQSC